MACAGVNFCRSSNHGSAQSCLSGQRQVEPTSDIEAGADHTEDPQLEDIMQTSDNLIAENSEDSHQIMQTHTAMHAMGMMQQSMEGWRLAFQWSRHGFYSLWHTMAGSSGCLGKPATGS